MKFSEFSQATQRELLFGEAQTTREWVLQQRVREMEFYVRALISLPAPDFPSVLGPELAPCTATRQKELFLHRVGGELTRPGGGYHFHIVSTGDDGSRYVDYYVHQETVVRSLNLSLTMTEIAKQMCQTIVRTFPYSAKDEATP